MHNIDNSAKIRDTPTPSFFLIRHGSTLNFGKKIFFENFFRKIPRFWKFLGKSLCCGGPFLKIKNFTFRIFEELSNEHTFGGLWAKIKNRHREKVFFSRLVFGIAGQKKLWNKMHFCLAKC